MQTRSERLKDLVSAAYREEHSTRGSIWCVEDMSRKISRETTTGLVPLWVVGAPRVGSA